MPDLAPEGDRGRGSGRAGAAPVVHKFGGSSVADGARIRRVAELVLAEEGPVVVVVSALGGTTDRLVAVVRDLMAGTAEVDAVVEEVRARHLAAVEQIAADDEERARLAGEVETELERLRSAGEPEGRSPEERMDDLCCLGEDLSARLLAAAIRAAGGKARVVDARLLVRTDDRFGRARPDEEAVRERAAEHLLPLVEDGCIPVVQGFIGSTGDGRTTTLGRGGSDYTASLLGAAVGSSLVHIWTDVDGILSGDPRAVDHPLILSEVGFEEAVELAWFGARVIHPGAAKHAVSRGLVLRIRNTFNPGAPGTRILPDRRGSAGIAAVAWKPDVALIKVRSHPSALPYGFLARVFEILARHRLPVDLVGTSHSSTAFTIDENENLDRIREELSAFAEVEVRKGLATLTVVGHGLMEEPGLGAVVFWEVERTPVHLISQASDVSLSLVVDREQAAPLIRKLHRTLIELRDEETRQWME